MIDGKLEFNTRFRTRWQRNYSEAQKFLDSEVLRGCEPYIPFRNGFLIQSGILGTNIGSGLVQWIAPYAKYQYYGKVMVGTKPKKVTDKNLTYHGGGLRGSYWFQRAKEVLKDVWIAGARALAGKS